MKRKKKSHRAIYGLMGAIVVATTIGTIAAKETKPYKAPELRLVRGSVDYDLTEGIIYDDQKYELMVEDIGDFDIDVLGRYDIKYSLTPLDEDEEITPVPDNAGIPKYDGPDLDPGFTVESEGEETTSSPDEAGIPKYDGPDLDPEFTVDSEETETTSASDNTDVSKNDGPDFNPESTVETVESVESVETETASSHTNEGETSAGTEQETEKKGNTFAGLLGRLTGHVYAAEAENTDVSLATPSDAEGGTLDDISGIIYFSRAVRVVASEYSNIEYDDPHLEIPASADLYGIQIQERIPVASDSNAEPDGDHATPSNAEAIEGSDGVTAEGVEYKLFLKNPDLILGDVAFTDADGKKVKKVKVTVKNDEELKSAVIVESNEQGAPVITGMELGTYTVTLAAVDPETEEEIICEREVHVVLNKCVVFDAPVLYIGTKNTSYDLTSRMLARDENGGPVEPIYVLNEEELLAAREEVQVKATPSNAEESTGETETGETETGETVTEVRLKKGTYHVTLGAKHPVSGDEFTVEREVRVVDAYYIYAPVLEIAAGSTDYDLLQGVEVKNDEGTTAAVEVKLKDTSELLTAAEAFETMPAESTEEEDNFAADTVTMYSENSADEKALSGNPALKEGSYSITLMANDPNTGEEIITERSISVRAAQYQLNIQYAKDKNNWYPMNYGLLMPDYDYNGGVYSKDEGVYSGNINGRYESRVYVYKINEAKLHALPTRGGYRETFWSNSNSGRGSNWELKSQTKGSWQNSFGRGGGLRRDYYSGRAKYDPDVSVVTYKPLNVDFFKQFSDMFDSNGESKWFSDWHGYRSLRVAGGTYSYSNLGHTTNNAGAYGGVNNPIQIPKGEFGLQFFLLSNSLDANDVPYQGLYFRLTDEQSHLSLDKVEVPNHVATGGIGVYRMGGNPRPRCGTIYVRGDYAESVPYTKSVVIRTGYGFQGTCPNYVIENVGRVDLETLPLEDEYGTKCEHGFDSAFMLNNVGSTVFCGNGHVNYVQSMILRKENELELYGGGELRFQKSVGNMDNSAEANDDTNKGVLKAGKIILHESMEIFKADTRKVTDPLITLLIYKEKYGETEYDMNGYVESNGYLIKARKQGDKPFVPNETYAHTDSGRFVLDATNFYVANPDEKTQTTEQDTLYFTAKNHGKTIVTTTLPTWPICVKNNADDSDTNYFKTYAEAINSLTTKSGSYTITNLVEREFTDADGTALQNFRNENITELIFSSGKRPADEADIDHGYYRIRARVQRWQLPAKMKVTFQNIVLKYEQGSQKQFNHQNLVFVKNGGSLTFDNDVFFLAGAQDSTGYAYVFGGITNQDCPDDVNILINSGAFTAVYGGGHGDNGTHSGAATITIGGTATVTETLSGGNIGSGQRNKGDKKSIITINAPLEVQNIYDYDEMTINVTGTDPTTGANKNVTVKNNIHSRKNKGTPNYTGVTILKGGSELVLKSSSYNSEFRVMGRLKLADDATEDAKLSFARTSRYQSDKSNVNIVHLMGSDPLYVNDPVRKYKIQVGYTTKNPTVGDWAFYLPNAADEEITTKHLKDMFVNKDGEHKATNGKYVCMMPKPTVKAIVLVNKCVGLSIKQDDETYSTPETYLTLKEALDALTAYETAQGGRSYRITIFADGYEFSEADKTAMGSMRTTTANEILWTSKVGPDGGDLGTAGTVLPAGDLTFFGTKSIVQDMTLKFAAQNSIYADGKPLEISNGVNISEGTGTFKPDLYGGSNAQLVKGDTSLTVLSGEFRNIYAGGNGGNVNGNTSLIMKGGLATSVYGGGNGGEVTGNSTVYMEVPNKAAEGGNTGKTDFTFGDISGQGTVKDGDLTPSVHGTKTVSVVPENKNTDLTVRVSNLTGFDQLTLGDETGAIDYAKQQFRIKTRFNNKVTDNDTTNKRNTVNLNRSALVLECGSGRIENLITKKVCALVIKRENDVTAFKDVTRPLLIDGRVTVSYTENTSPEGVTKVYDKIKLMYVDQKNSADGDVMVTYSQTTNTDPTEAIFYEDGTNGNLPTRKMDRDNGTSDIILSSKKAHTMEGEVIYPDDKRIEDASKPGEGIEKVIVVNYDPKNEHEVAGGYVVKIPKDMITDKKYTENWMKTDGTDAFVQQDGVEMIHLTFKGTGDRNGSKGTTDKPVLIEENCFYVAHVACKNGDKSSLLLDVTAPRQSKTSGEAFGDYEGDGVNGKYYMHGDSSDYNITDKNLLPNAPSDFQSLGTKLPYTPHGVKLAAWSFGDADGNADFEKAVAKADFGANPGDKIPEGLHLINIKAAADAALCEIKFEIQQKAMETAIAAGQKYLVVYVKDKVNNTAKYIIPMSDSMIDVKVPTRVSLVALKKSGTGLDATACKLLAPTCYIVNYGKRQVKAEVALFNKDDTQLLKLVDGDDTTDYTPNQIALYLKSTGSGLASNADDTNVDTKFNLRNVLSIVDEKGKRAYLGTLEPKSNDKRTLDFTFGAYYDPAKIQEIDGWLTNTMSYHFSVVKTVAPGQDPNPAPPDQNQNQNPPGQDTNPNPPGQDTNPPAP